jgi:ketosteroid isomerase-like protein
MRKRVRLVLLFLLCCFGLTAFAQTDSDEAPVRKLISEFESALARKDIAKIGSFVSPQIVVFENGYRNNGW